MNEEEKKQRYISLSHAVQTGIAWSIALENPGVADVNSDPNLRAHKHLRTGIDITKSDTGALVRLLIKKGVFTHAEYADALIEGLEREVELKERDVSQLLGRQIKLA